MSFLDGRWKTEAFHPKGQWGLLKDLWSRLSEQLEDEAMAKYKVLLRQMLLGLMGVNHFDDETKELISAEAKDISGRLVKLLMTTCQMVEYEDLDYDVEGVSGRKNAELPTASNLNAVLMLACLEKDIEFPDNDCAMEFNRVLRFSVQNVIEAAVSTTKTCKLTEHGFLRYFWNPAHAGKAPNGHAAKAETITNVEPRDFFDSILLTDTVGGGADELFARLEKSESLTNFYYKMMKLSYPHLEKNGL